MRKPERVRWGLEKASAEFNINPRTLSARLKQAAIDPDEDGYYSTLKIVRAIYNDLESERIRKTRAEADQIEKENAKLDGILIDVAQFNADVLPVLVEIKRIIMSSDLSESAKDEILGKLAKAYDIDETSAQDTSARSKAGAGTEA